MYRVLVLIVMIVMIVSIHRLCNNIEIFRYATGRPGPTILLLAGTHGNEPAGRVMLQRYIDNARVGKPSPLSMWKKGTLLIVPCANRSGCFLGSRWMWHRVRHNDLNRNYAEEGSEPVSQRIIQLILAEQVELIVDFHEGWGFHLQQPKSIGSTLTPTTPLMRALSLSIVDELNANITNPGKHFSVRNETDHLPTLRNFATRNGLDYILVETTGIDEVQPLSTRLAHVDCIVRRVISSAQQTV